MKVSPLIVFIVYLFVGCDKQNEEFSLDGKYKIKRIDALYLCVYPVSESEVPDRTAGEKLYKELIFDPIANQRKSSYIYINLYEGSGKFRFQTYWDPRKEKFEISSKEFY